jgi:outer membrane protein OmpA-like peptidoglycan-associated protein
VIDLRLRLSFPVLCAALALSAAARAQDPQAKVLALEGKVLDIEGVTLGLDAVLRDLGAQVTDREIHIELSADVLFDFDKAELRPDALASLREVAAVIAGNPGRPVLIEGHTDDKGTDAYNQALSERRAASVKSWLVGDGGIEAQRISTRGLGETRPKLPNEAPDGSDSRPNRQQNRRVEITIQRGA